MLSILAMYLPQFHRVPENDKWWGEGFTEWTAVKGAKKLFTGHYQPRIPLNNFYYDLLDYNTMVWQTKLMKKYYVDGACFYHYWFENGKRILEKPAENLLKWTDIDMPFCFCWANETWSRTWKNLPNGNVWSSIYEKKGNAAEGILLRQCYGREREWEEHFQYLLTFFKDERYIKLNGKPVFMIWKPSLIYSIGSMTRYFIKRAKENGLTGLYIIGVEDSNLSSVDAYCIRQPAEAFSRYNQKNKYNEYGIKRYPYSTIWENVLNKKIRNDKKAYLFGIVDYDDTPRMGKEKGHLIEDASPDTFYKYFKKLYQKSLYLNNDFVFLNAWNEWGEGMYLEPDEKNKFGYLEAIRKVVIECRENEAILCDEKTRKLFFENDVDETMRKNNESLAVLQRHDALLDTWLSLHEKKVNFSIYLEKYRYKKVAIYGMGKLGIHLLNELKKANVNVVFGIDINRKNNNCGIQVYHPEDIIPDADAVIITIIDQYTEIGNVLSKQISGAMVTIEEMLQELSENLE